MRIMFIDSLSTGILSPSSVWQQHDSYVAVATVTMLPLHAAAASRIVVLHLHTDETTILEAFQVLPLTAV